MHSLRTKIIILSVWITVTAVVVISLLSVFFIRNNEHHNSDQLLLLMCETGERNLDYYFNSVEQSVKDVAAYAEKDLSGLDDDRLQANVDSVQAYFDLIANKTNGVLTYYYRIDPSISSNVKGFWYTNLDGKRFTEHAVTDITQYDTEDTSKLVWFTVPKHKDHSIWLPPYVTDNLDVNVISFNYPIHWRKQFVGVIGIEIDYSTMAEQVQSIRVYNNGYAFLTDEAGNLIYHPRIDLATVSEDEVPAIPDGLFSESTFVNYTFEGVKKEASWLRMSNGMRLYVSVPEEETEGSWRMLLKYVMFASGIVLAVSILMTMFVTTRITRPLKQLTEAAKLADQGNFDFKVDYKGNDEVGALTQTFLNMADHVKEHISDLNKRVYVDALTSVRNKGGYENFITEMQKQLEESPASMEYAIGIFDCDDLKSINDQYGHDKGDIYLKTASRLICRVFQHSPVFRIGGDEFSVVLRNDDYRNRADLIDAFERESAKINAVARNSWEEVHVSIGIAVYDPEVDHSVNDTIRHADKMMYTNKRKHKETDGQA